MVMRKKVFYYEFTCYRCGRTWESKNKHPLCCGKCKSPYWDKPRLKDLVKSVSGSDAKE